QRRCLEKSVPRRHLSERPECAPRGGGGLHSDIYSTQRPSSVEAFSPFRREILLNIDFFDEAHSRSSLFGCLLERHSSGANPGELKARKGNSNYSSQAYTPSNLYACFL